MKKLSTSEVKTALATMPGWKKKGATIARSYPFKDFPAAIKFVRAVAGIVEPAGFIRTLTSAGTGWRSRSPRTMPVV